MGTLRFAKGRHSRPEDDRWSTGQLGGCLHTGRRRRNAGQVGWVHNLNIDSKGNIDTAEVETGKRVQKFTRVGG